jgi:endonuclease YncB( thermonuclease family)
VNQVIECYVYRVYDGDTIKVLIDYKNILFKLSVRLLDIDTPEIRGGVEKEKVAGIYVRDHLRGILEGKVVKLYATGWDKYGGRIDGHIWIQHGGEENISDYLIRLGYAKRYDASAGPKSPWTDSE